MADGTTAEWIDAAQRYVLEAIDILTGHYEGDRLAALHEANRALRIAAEKAAIETAPTPAIFVSHSLSDPEHPNPCPECDRPTPAIDRDGLARALHAAQIDMVRDPESRWMDNGNGGSERFIPAHVAIRITNEVRAALAEDTGEHRRSETCADPLCVDALAALATPKEPSDD